MKIVILHQDLEWSEIKIKEEFENLGVDASLISINAETVFEECKKADLVLNRVYASVANRNYTDIEKTLHLLKNLETNGVNCINSYETSLADYSKFHSYLRMKEVGVNTPKTKIISKKPGVEDLKKFINELNNFPLILKRDSGGRGEDVVKIDSFQELINELNKRFSKNYFLKYNGNHILQEFIKSNEGFDCRICIVNGKFSHSFKRSLISTNEEGGEKWLASVSRGSVKDIYEPTPEEIKLAIKASKSIGADFNEIDLVFSEEGLSVIENNPTPNYVKGDEEKISQFVKCLMEDLVEIKK